MILNFIPQLWSATIMDVLEKALVLGKVAGKPFEGNIESVGDSIKIPGIGEIDVAAYTKNTTITWQTLSDAGIIMKIDQQNYFAFKVDDIDKLQANVNLMTAAGKKAAYKLRDTADQYIAALYSQAGLTTVTDASVDTATVISDIAELHLALEEVNVPDENMWLAIPPWVSTKLLLAGIVHADDLKGLINGFIGNVLGFDMYKSNNIYNSGGVYYPMAGSYDAIAFVQQIVKTEAVRIENEFSDGVKGLHVYGAKVIKPQELIYGTFTELAETTI